MRASWGDLSSDTQPLMISAPEAHEIAARHLQELVARTDAMLQPWREATADEPILVRTTDLDPSHWIIPVVTGGAVLGYIEVDANGDLLGHTYLYEVPGELGDCPAVATRITADEASQLVAEHLEDRRELRIGGPVFVVDAAGDRLAWMMEIWDGDRLVSLAFATPNHVYERLPTERKRRPGLRG